VMSCLFRFGTEVYSVVPRIVFEKFTFWTRFLSLVGLSIYMPISEIGQFGPWEKMLSLENCSTDKSVLIVVFGLISIGLLGIYFFAVRSSVAGFISGFFLRIFAPVIIYIPFSFIYYDFLLKKVNGFQSLNDCFIRVQEYWTEEDSTPGSVFVSFIFNFLVFIVLELAVITATAIRNTFHSGEPL
jgi:hypothetical protein